MKTIEYIKVFLTYILTVLVIYMFGVLCSWSWNPANWNIYGRITLAVVWFWKTLDYVELIQDNLYHKEYETEEEE